jgi:putative phage-type endonuclease
MLSAEQHALRLTGIGSSDVAAIVGVSPYASAHDVWLVKRGLAEFKGNTATELGHYFEPVIASIYADKTGSKLELHGETVQGREPWMLATPDYMVTSPERKLLEVKHVGMRTMGHWGSEEDGVPYFYLTQVQWQMHVTGIHTCDVAAVLGGIDFRSYTVRYDQELATMLERACRDFWFEHVTKGIAPKVDGSEGAKRMLSTLYPRNERPLVIGGPDAQVWMERLQKAEAEEERIAKEKLRAQNELKALIGDADGIVGAEYRATWKATKTGNRRFVFDRKKGAA